MKFNSQICTTREQSERLLALGLNKETADMHWYRPAAYECDYWFVGVGMEWGSSDIPAWSLHRLFQIHTNGVISSSWNMAVFNWDDLIDCIEEVIKRGNLNKEYLEE